MKPHQFRTASVTKQNKYEELEQLLNMPYFDPGTIIIKSNWVSTEPVDFTDVDSLRVLNGAVDSKIGVATA